MFQKLFSWLKSLFAPKPPTLEDVLKNHDGPVIIATPKPNADPVNNAVPRRINAEGLALVEYYEGLFLKAYQDSVGVWTIGLGRIKYDDGAPVKSGDTCTKEQADEWLQFDLETDGGHYVRAWIKSDLNDNQYAALTSFCFNRGAGRFRELLAMPGKIEDNLLHFDYAGTPPKSLLGLQRRRRSERALYLGQDWKLFKDWNP